MMLTLRARLALGAAVAVAACATAAQTAPHFVDRAPADPPPQAGDAYYQAGSSRIAAAEAPGRARNVILFIGDGMGVSTVTAARILAGQRAGVDGESYQLTLDTFPRTAMSRTYSNDFQISDSASTATAMTTGVKTNTGMIGVTSNIARGDCTGALENEAMTLFEIAETHGLATGVVSTARITHATPASVYAHTPNRDWEADGDPSGPGSEACADIARQLVEWPFGDGLEIAMGGGRANFLPAETVDPEHAEITGRRTDGRNLAEEWTTRDGEERVYVWNAAAFDAHDFTSSAHVLGLFSPSHMAYEVDRADDVGGEPSLSEMTAAAITRLSQDEDGFVLMVEGGRIDHAHHAGQPGRALTDAIALDEAVRTALEMTSREDTLVVVTADHSHTLTIAGYSRRGADILGLSTPSEFTPMRAADGLPYTTLAYANGPGAVPGARDNLAMADFASPDFRPPALVPMTSETHGGEDVVIYAWGPGEALFSGTLEQNVIFHALGRASGLVTR